MKMLRQFRDRGNRKSVENSIRLQIGPFGGNRTGILDRSAHTVLRRKP